MQLRLVRKNLILIVPVACVASGFSDPSRNIHAEQYVPYDYVGKNVAEASARTVAEIEPLLKKYESSYKLVMRLREGLWKRSQKFCAGSETWVTDFENTIPESADRLEIVKDAMNTRERLIGLISVIQHDLLSRNWEAWADHSGLTDVDYPYRRGRGFLGLGERVREEKPVGDMPRPFDEAEYPCRDARWVHQGIIFNQYRDWFYSLKPVPKRGPTVTVPKKISINRLIEPLTHEQILNYEFITKFDRRPRRTFGKNEITGERIFESYRRPELKDHEVLQFFKKNDEFNSQEVTHSKIVGTLARMFCRPPTIIENHSTNSIFDVEAKSLLAQELQGNARLPLQFTELRENIIPFECLDPIGSYSQRLRFNFRSAVPSPKEFLMDLRISDSKGDFLGVRKVLITRNPSNSSNWARVSRQPELNWSYWRGPRCVSPDASVFLLAVSLEDDLLHRYCIDETLYARLSEVKRMGIALLLLQRQVDGISFFIKNKQKNSKDDERLKVASKVNPIRVDVPGDFLDPKVSELLDGCEADPLRDFIRSSLLQDTIFVRQVRSSQSELLKVEMGAKAILDQLFEDAAYRFFSKIEGEIDDREIGRRVKEKLQCYVSTKPLFLQNQFLLDEWCTGAKATASYAEGLEARRTFKVDQTLGGVAAPPRQSSLKGGAHEKPDLPPVDGWRTEVLEETLLESISKKVFEIRKRVDGELATEYLESVRRTNEKRWE